MDNQRLSTLLAGTAQRDASAFSQLYQEFSPTVYGIALSVVKEPHTAADATQEVFLRLWTLPPRALPPGEPRRLAVHRHPPPGLGAPPAPAAPVLGGGPSPAGAFLPLGKSLGLAVLPRAAGAPGRAVPANRHLEAGGGLHPPGDCRPAPPEPRHRPLEVRQGHPRAAAVLGGLAGGFAAGLFGTAGAAAPSPHRRRSQRGRPRRFHPASPSNLAARGAAFGSGGRPLGRGGLFRLAALEASPAKKVNTRQQNRPPAPSLG